MCRRVQNVWVNLQSGWKRANYTTHTYVYIIYTYIRIGIVKAVENMTAFGFGGRLSRSFVYQVRFKYIRSRYVLPFTRNPDKNTRERNVPCEMRIYYKVIFPSFSLSTLKVFTPLKPNFITCTKIQNCSRFTSIA